MQVINVDAPGGPATIYAVESRQDSADWAGWVEARRDLPLGLDLETNALDPWEHGFRTRTVQTADGREAWVVPTRSSEYSDALVAGMLRRHPLWVAHFAEADIRFAQKGLELRDTAIRIEWDSTPHVVDTQAVLAVYDPRTVTSASKRDRVDVRIPRPKGLKDVSERLLGPELRAAEVALHRRFGEIAPKDCRSRDALSAYGFANIDVTERVFRTYAGLDPIVTIRLWWLMRRELERRGQWHRAELAMVDQWQVDLQTLRGLPIDGPYARWLDGQLQAVTDRRAGWLMVQGIAPSGQGPAVGRAFEMLGVSSPVVRNGKPSWDRSALSEIAGPEEGPSFNANAGSTAPAVIYPPQARWLARAVLDVRRAGKFRVTYVQPMLDALTRDGRLHPSSRALGTVTTRETAQRPPVHQLPKRDTRVRAAVRAARGWVLVTADFRQGEPFTMAARSGDEDYLRDLEQGDINGRIAALVYGDAYLPAEGKSAGTDSYLRRQAGKFAWLAACYGAAARKVAVLLGLPEEQGAEILGRWHAAYPRLWAYARELNQRTHVRLDSGAVVPLWDRFRVDDVTGELHLRTWEDGNPRPSRLGLNADTQGTQADLLRFAKHRLRARGLAWALLFSLHDELLIMVPAWMAEWARGVLEDCMTVTYRGVTVRCEATIEGRTWLEQPRDFDPAVLSAVDDE